MSSADLLGRTVGKYRLERSLGHGGMAQIYFAVHATLGRAYAVKVLDHAYAQRQDLARRFFNEARAAAALDHANIVEVYDFDLLPDGRPYIVMEFLDGESLAQLLRRERRVTPERTFELLAPVCSALAAAHRSGIVHRDLKPENVFLSKRDGSPERVKVLDFGIAKLVDGTAGGTTSAGVVLGTPLYMSPEQALSQNDLVGPASDVYSLGVIAHRMLAGHPPFQGQAEDFVVLAMRHAKEPPPPLRQLCGDVSADLEAVVLRALAKSPADRYASMDDFAQALASVCGSSQVAALATFVSEAPVIARHPVSMPPKLLAVGGATTGTTTGPGVPDTEVDAHRTQLHGSRNALWASAAIGVTAIAAVGAAFLSTRARHPKVVAPAAAIVPVSTQPAPAPPPARPTPAAAATPVEGTSKRLPATRHAVERAAPHAAAVPDRDSPFLSP